ncbi:hypothetical protein Airi01_099730 [Actinoallomurus iriomotensis]|uniref:Uncharacterized protein n=1 Tax=Actinoallomurus iriomotensis TaxID=478107 RepID=A0A9W6RTS8_9ACTN|nr:hypothetical protein Airi01_099730 [Actinoallomurus iriomotensis]
MVHHIDPRDAARDRQAHRELIIVTPSGVAHGVGGQFRDDLLNTVDQVMLRAELRIVARLGIRNEIKPFHRKSPRLAYLRGIGRVDPESPRLDTGW